MRECIFWVELIPLCFCLRSTSLMSILPFFNNEDFDWMHGYSLVYQLLRGNDAPNKILGNTISEWVIHWKLIMLLYFWNYVLRCCHFSMKRLNKFLTMELIQERDKVQTGFLDDVILIPSSLAHITEYNDDPLVSSFFLQIIWQLKL